LYKTKSVKIATILLEQRTEASNIILTTEAVDSRVNTNPKIVLIIELEIKAEDFGTQNSRLRVEVIVEIGVLDQILCF
jgi:hypothetical protein